MLIAIEHITSYRYATPVTYGIQSLRLTPSEFDGQKVLEWQVGSRPAGETCAARDGFGNPLHLLTVAGPHDTLEIIARGVVSTEDRHGMVNGLAEGVPLRVFLKRSRLTMPTPEIVAIASLIGTQDPIPTLHTAMAAIRDRVAYVTGVTHAATTAGEALTAREGVCQDHAHIFISAARVAGMPARYVSGYLLTDGVETAEANHAWAEVHIDGLGWLAFDVANGICPTDRYVRIAAGIDAIDAAPIRGWRHGGGEEKLEVTVRVNPLKQYQSQSSGSGPDQQQQQQQQQFHSLPH